MIAGNSVWSKLIPERVAAYLRGHEHLPVEAHLGSKELGPEMFAVDGQP